MPEPEWSARAGSDVRDPSELAAVIGRRLATRTRKPLEIPGFRRAAVLVPLLLGSHGLELFFTIRSKDLPNHAGQIAFPGGRLEAGEGAEDAARRETYEEVGIRVGKGDLLERLDDLPSPAGYVATPVAALLAWPQRLELNHREVSEVFTAPLEELHAVIPARKLRRHPRFKGVTYSYLWQGHCIWGFTGNVLKNLLDVYEDSVRSTLDLPA